MACPRYGEGDGFTVVKMAGGVWDGIRVVYVSRRCFSARLLRLSVNGAGLKGTLPASLGNLTALTYVLVRGVY